MSKAVKLETDIKPEEGEVPIQRGRGADGTAREDEPVMPSWWGRWEAQQHHWQEEQQQRLVEMMEQLLQGRGVSVPQQPGAQGPPTEAAAHHAMPASPISPKLQAVYDGHQDGPAASVFDRPGTGARSKRHPRSEKAVQELTAPAIVDKAAPPVTLDGPGAVPAVALGDAQLRRGGGPHFESEVKLLATFDGKENWDSFAGPLERLATKRGWDDAQRLDALYMRLRGNAMSFVAAQPKVIQEDYKRLMGELKRRFGEEIPKGTARRKLAELRQGKEMSLSVFGEEVRRLITQAYSEVAVDLQEQFAVDAFLRGLNDQKIAYEVMGHYPATLVEAMVKVEAREHDYRATLGKDTEAKNKLRRVAWEDEQKLGTASPSPMPPATPQSECKTLAVEIVKEMHRCWQSLSPTAAHQAPSFRGEAHLNEERGRTLGRNSSSRQRSPSPAPVGRGPCYECGQEGHFKRDCASRSQSPTTRSRPGTENTVRLGRATADGPSLVVPITVNHLALKCVVDTGAEATVMSHDTFQQLQLKGQTSTGTAVLRNAQQGNEMGPVEKYRVNIRMGSKNCDWDVYVAPIDDPFLLGLDFVLAAGITISAGGQVQIQGEPIATTIMGRAFTGYAVSRVLLQDPSVLPAESEQDVWGVVEVPKPGVSAVLEPANIAEGVLSGRVVVDVAQRVPIRLCNLSANEVILRKGLCLGVLVEAKEEPLTLGSDVVDEEPTRLRRVETRKTEELPEHLLPLYEAASQGLQVEHRDTLRQLLIQYQGIFAVSDKDLGCFSAVQHRIDTGHNRPVRQAARRTALGFQEEEENHLRGMLESGVVQPSESEWASPVVLVRKKDGGVRWCIDYRKLNELTLKDAYPLPKIEECLDTLEGATVFSTLDMQSGYWQIEVHPEDRGKTAFITRYGLFQYTRMPFGLCNAPGTFQRAMEVVLRGLQWTTLLVYLDDVIILGKGVEDGLRNLAMVFGRMQTHGLKLKPSKCQLLKSEVLFLGHVVNSQGIAPNPGLVSAVQDWSTPNNITELQSFLGLCNYYRRFVRDFAHVCSPLYELQCKGEEFHWGASQQEAFEQVKRQLTSSPVLAYPIQDGEFVLDTDASHTCIGAVLSQVQGGQEKVIAYASAHLQKPQVRYCVTRKELLAVVRFVRQFRHYLLGRRFTVRTDHHSLTWLFRFRNPEGQLARWLEELSQFDFQIEHRPGVRHGNADALSRAPESECDCYHAGDNPDSLPCRGCHYCLQRHHKWARFDEDVDDVVPLAVRRIGTRRRGNRQSQAEPPTVNWLAQYSTQELAEFQQADPVLKVLHVWNDDHDSFPSQEQVALEGPAIRKYWLLWDQIEQREGVLYYHWDRGPPETRAYRLIVPAALQEEVLNSCHCPPLSGHLGRWKTQHRVEQAFFWVGLAESVAQFVRCCPQCQACKSSDRAGRATMQLYQAGAPMDRVHIDVVGPFPVSQLGNKYVLVMIDQFTRWVEAAAVGEQTAEITARTLLREFFSRFGVPLEVHTDQGRNFESALFAELCDLLQIVKTRTTPYHPASNGQVERFNRTLLQMIRCYVSNNQRDWDEHLHLLTAAYRSSPHACTGFTPNKMMLGREVHQPQGLALRAEEANIHRSAPADYVRELELKMLETHELARQRLRAAQVRSKRDYDLRAKQRVFGPGDLVYVRDSAKRKGLSPKLQPRWRGPYLITARLGHVLYRIHDGRKERVLHHDRLLPYLADVVPGWVHRRRHALLQDAEAPDTTLATGGQEIPAQGTGALSKTGNEEDLGLAHLFNRPDMLVDVEPEGVAPEADSPLRQTRSGREVRVPEWYQA